MPILLLLGVALAVFVIVSIILLRMFFSERRWIEEQERAKALRDAAALEAAPPPRDMIHRDR